MEWKYIIVKEDVSALEKLINDKGWEVKTAFQHPKGVMIGLARRKIVKRPQNPKGFKIR